MKVIFPDATFFSKSILVAAGLAAVGYVLYPFMGVAAEDGAMIFGSGLAVGAIFGAPLSALRFVANRAPKAQPNEPVKSVFVGNLAFKSSEDELRQLFAKYGEVKSVRIMTDRMTRRPRGFGFVEMNERGAEAAIRALNEHEFCGRKLRVNEANQRNESHAA